MIAGIVPIFIGIGVVKAQIENIQPKPLDLPDFYFDALSFLASDSVSTRFDVYVQVPFEYLRFTKESNFFKARYEITLDVLKPNKELVTEKIWNEEVRVKIFEETVSKKGYNLTLKSLTLPPGEYLLHIQMRDYESKKTSIEERGVNIPSFQNTLLSVSDVMLVGKLTAEGQKKNIAPNVSSNVGNLPEGFYLFFEVYNRTSVDTANITYHVLDQKQRVVFSHSLREPVKKNKNQIFVKIDSLQLPMGTYELLLEVKPATRLGEKISDTETLIASTHRRLNIRWYGMPVSIVDLDKAIEQMVYIAKGGELDYIKDAPTEEEKRRRFMEFWKKRNPTPNTPRNEAMEEYYSRVEYANQHFSRYREGWKTDMGMIFIIFGPPNNVDRHPFEYNRKPYEIWYYYDLDRQFLFVDETGFGDYRLVGPYWDVYRQPR